MPPPPGPPVPQDSDCHATMCRLSWRRSSRGRSRRACAGHLQFRIALQHDAYRLAPAFLEIAAVAMPQRSGQICCRIHPPRDLGARGYLGGIFRGSAIWPAIPDTFWVDMCTNRWSSSVHSEMEPWLSRQQWVMTGAPYRPSETTSAWAKAFSASPCVTAAVFW